MKLKILKMKIAFLTTHQKCNFHIEKMNSQGAD